MESSYSHEDRTTHGESFRHNDEVDGVSKEDKIQLRTAFMKSGNLGLQWLTVGHAIEPLQQIVPIAPVPSSDQTALSRPPSVTEIPDLVPSYANSAPSEEEEADDAFDEAHFPAGELIASPSTSSLLTKPTYQPDAALIDVVDDPFAELRDSVRLMTGQTRLEAERELDAHEVHQEMESRLQEAMW